MTVEELRNYGYEVYGFHRAADREAYRANTLRLFPQAETETADWTWHEFTVFFLGIKMQRGKVAAQAALEAACD